MEDGSLQSLFEKEEEEGVWTSPSAVLMESELRYLRESETKYMTKISGMQRTVDQLGELLRRALAEHLTDFSDHLGVDRFHVAGMCIGGSYCMGLIQAAPRRVASAVLFQPIGLLNNRQAFFEMFDGWAKELQATHPEANDTTWQAFKQTMYSGDFLFNVSREFVARCPTPLLVLLGNDQYHPAETSREVVALAPNATLVEHWKEPEYHAAAKAAVEQFLAKHTPR